MNKKNNDGNTINIKRDINYSTRYDDRELIIASLKEKLDALTINLNREIIGSCDCIEKLERLADRYYSDGIAAQAENNMGYYMRYVAAYERIKSIVEAGYSMLPKPDIR